MKRFKHIINEVRALEKFQVYTDLIKYLKQDFGLSVDIEIFANFIDIYTSELRDNNTDVSEISEDKVSKAIKTFFNSKDYLKKAEAVWVTEYGYVIVLESDTDIFEEKLLQENALYYYYHADVLEETDEIKQNFIMSSGKSLKTENKKVILETETEAETEGEEITHDTVASDTSNIILDQKFVWFFNVLNELEQELETDILELEDAIETLIDLDAKMIVALPYVDPNPEDNNVDLIFAENPGPVIVYDGR